MSLRQSPDLQSALSRRTFLEHAGAAATLAAMGGAFAAGESQVGNETQEPESLVKVLYASLSDSQKKTVCFDWDYVHPKRGLLRTRVENNWRITAPTVNGPFYTKEQQALIREIFQKMLNPEWVPKIDQQLKDDSGGPFGHSQGIAIFGHPGQEKFEFVMTGRHLTLRCDGHSAEHVAFGGPIFHGHAAKGFYEKKDHPGNIFWPQALEANKLYQMLDSKHRDEALILMGMPTEEKVAFHGKNGKFTGIPVTEFASDQKEQLQKVLAMLIEPYRRSDRDWVTQCLKTQGGLDACNLAFYKEADIGEDGVWDNWRLEGPSFVWNFRGKPHVHIWINVSDDAKVELNAFQNSVM
jgi:hypothetical protein